jgi:hypothetical protein
LSATIPPEDAEELRRLLRAGSVILSVPEDLQDALQGMRPEEVENFLKLVRMEPKAVQKILDFMDVWQSFCTTARVLKWLGIGVMGFVLAGITFAKNVHDGWEFIRGWISR